MLVNKEMALRLKKIGFNEPCDYASSGDSDYTYLAAKMPWKTEVPWKIKNSEMEWDFPGGVRPGRCTRPDKSDVFKWFRDKGIIGEVGWSDYGFYYWLISKPEVVSENPGQETWEEAEDACILHMIKILNNEIHP